MAPDNALVTTLTSVAVSVFGTGGIAGALVWLAKQGSTQKGAQYDSYVKAQGDVYTAFNALLAEVRSNAADLRTELAAEREHSRKQDAALRECEERGDKLDQLNEQLVHELRMAKRDAADTKFMNDRVIAELNARIADLERQVKH
jgi:uncharacterized membrane protein